MIGVYSYQLHIIIGVPRYMQNRWQLRSFVWSLRALTTRDRLRDTHTRYSLTNGGVCACSIGRCRLEPEKHGYGADPVPRPANVLGEENAAVVVALDGPALLQCYAFGWPRPAVTWWRADRMLPMSSDLYDQRPDSSLVVRLATVNVLGLYTCQAYNGRGRAASWSVTLRAYGPSGDRRPYTGPFSQYLVPPPRHSAAGDGIRLRPIAVNKQTRPPPIYRIATTTTSVGVPTTYQNSFVGKQRKPSFLRTYPSALTRRQEFEWKQTHVRS